MPEVVRTWKSGGYGTTVWFHELSCGHVVTGRRRSAKPTLPCDVCDQLSMLPTDIEPPVDEVDRPLPAEVNPDETAHLLEGEARIRLLLAARLGVTPESVRIVGGGPDGPVGAIVVLVAAQVAEVLSRPPAGG